MAHISRDDNVRTLGSLEDFDGRRLEIGVDYDTVTLCPNYRLTAEQCLDFGLLFFRAYAIVAGRPPVAPDPQLEQAAAEALDELRQRLGGES